LQSCLDIHETYFRGCYFEAWASDFKNWMKLNFPFKRHKRYITFHDGRHDVVSLANLSSKTLLEELARIHCYYCQLQKKPSSIYVHSFKDQKRGETIPELSASYGKGRWGLFGYRLEASNELFYSRKYRD
jgi:hypothetical protein